MKAHLVSILICSRDRRKALEALVTSLMNMETDCPFDIVIVEETGNPVPLDGTIYVPHPIANRGIPYARNLALANAKGEITVFLDDDCTIHDGWLDSLLEPFRDDSVVGVQGGVTVPNGTNAIGWAESLLGFPGGGIARVLKAEGATQRTNQISTLNCAYRKWVVDQVGGFEKSLKIAGEDYVLAKQACQFGDCLYIPKAMVSHEARGKFYKIWDWFVRRGRAEVDVIKSGTQEQFSAGTLLRSSLTIKLLSLFVLFALFPAFSGYFLLAGFFLYVFMQYARCYGIWRESRSPFMAFILLPLVKLTMDVAVDWGRLRGLAFD